jgi:hypothetical protein
VAGLVAPWNADKLAAGDFLLSKFQLREGSGAVEVSEHGLYYIYAQVRNFEADVKHSDFILIAILIFWFDFRVL